MIGGLHHELLASGLTSKLTRTKFGRSSWNRGSMESTWKFVALVNRILPCLSTLSYVALLGST